MSANEGLDALAARECKSNALRLTDADLRDRLTALPGWAIRDIAIEKTFTFQNYQETLAFVNAVAYIAHRADHHPHLAVDYNRCTVSWSTHSSGGITDNDAICAARVERLLR
jgi:4a-hydroxytetrahydrobiopterin dehydratase